jgi:hypothetical protein
VAAADVGQGQADVGLAVPADEHVRAIDLDDGAGRLEHEPQRREVGGQLVGRADAQVRALGGEA